MIDSDADLSSAIRGIFSGNANRQFILIKAKMLKKKQCLRRVVRSAAVVDCGRTLVDFFRNLEQFLPTSNLWRHGGDVVKEIVLSSESGTSQSLSVNQVRQLAIEQVCDVTEPPRL